MLESKKIINFFISAFGFLAFAQVTFFPVAIYYGSMCLLVAVLFIYTVLPRASVDAKLARYFSLFLFCFLIGVFSYPVSMEIESRFDYSQLNIFGRVFNLTILSFIFVLIGSYHQRFGEGCDRYLLVVRSYYFGVFLVVLVGIWQFISFCLPVPFLFETRSHLHSTFGASYSFSARLTSLAREPSYFVMLAIDFIGLSLFFYSGLKRIFAVVLGLFMVVFSLSPSGFIVFSGVLLIALFFTQLKYFSGRVECKKIVTSLVLVFVACSFFITNEQIFKYIGARVFDADLSNSSRFYMVVMPYLWSLDGSVFSVIFGYGMKSYSIIGSYYHLPSGVPVHPTSNNIYTDVFWESGLLGLLCLIGFFAVIFIAIFKSKASGRHYSFIAFYFLFNLILSGFFRADYASARFFIILYLIYYLVYKSNFKGVGNDHRSSSA